MLSVMDVYLPWIGGSLFALLENIAFAHFYGVKKVAQQIEKMNGRKIWLSWYWQFVLPPILLVSFCCMYYVFHRPRNPVFR